ncbi:MAG: tetratricopeptide repeat protein, partial [Verrucomicrobiota bacterium]
IQCWMQCARWDKAVAAADIYLEKFDNSDQDERVPTVLMLKADSYREMPERAKALEVYAEVVERFPTGTLAPRALFMQGILFLEDDENDKAIAAFDEVRERFRSHGIAEDAHYWKGMASSFAKDYSQAREVLFDYLNTWKEKGRYRVAAAFRTAFCAHASADYNQGIAELSGFLEAHPGSPYESEAEILLGDGLLNEGRMEEGIATYRAIAPEDARFFEEGWFKIGKALRLFATSSTPTAIDESFVERLIGVRGKFNQWWKETEKGEIATQIRKHAARYGGNLESDLANPGDAFVEWMRETELLAKHYGIKGTEDVDLDRRRFQQAVYEEWWTRRSRTMWLEVVTKHFGAFAKNYPKSPRLAESVYWTGWALQQGGDEKGAREIYWKTIREQGNDPAQVSVVSLLQGLEKLYKSRGELSDFDRELNQLARRAETENKATLQLWAHWARATGLHVDPSVRELNFDRAVRLADPSIHSPLILADCADYLFAQGKMAEARELYTDFRKWNPRAIERERAFYGLAAIAAGEEDWEEAEYQLLRLQRHGVTNSLVADGRILLAEVQLKKGDMTAARATYEELLKEKFIPARKKCEVLVSLGDLLVQLEEKKPALAVFERVYIGYGRYPDLVAQAYWKRGSLLEELGMEDKAAEVYQEMTSRADLEGEPDTKKARERLKEISPETEEAAA